MDSQRNYNLGIELQDTVTGFRGIATAKVEYIGGMVSYRLESKCNNKTPESQSDWYRDSRLEPVVGETAVEHETQG